MEPFIKNSSLFDFRHFHFSNFDSTHHNSFHFQKFHTVRALRPTSSIIFVIFLQLQFHSLQTRFENFVAQFFRLFFLRLSLIKVKTYEATCINSITSGFVKIVTFMIYLAWLIVTTGIPSAVKNWVPKPTFYVILD